MKGLEAAEEEFFCYAQSHMRNNSDCLSKMS